VQPHSIIGKNLSILCGSLAVIVLGSRGAVPQISICGLDRGGSRISERGVLIAGTDSSGGDTEKFSRGCLQRFVSTNLNVYVSSGAGFKNFRGHPLFF